MENGRTRLIVLGQIVHTLFISNIIHCGRGSYIHACEKDGEEGGRGQIHSVERVHVGKMRGEGEGEDNCVWWRECMRE